MIFYNDKKQAFRLGQNRFYIFYRYGRKPYHFITFILLFNYSTHERNIKYCA